MLDDTEARLTAWFAAYDASMEPAKPRPADPAKAAEAYREMDKPRIGRGWLGSLWV